MTIESPIKELTIKDNKNTKRLFDVLSDGDIADHMNFALSCLGYGFAGRDEYLAKNACHFATPEDGINYVVTNFVLRKDEKQVMGDPINEQNQLHIKNLTILISGCNLSLLTFVKVMGKVIKDIEAAKNE